MENGISTKETSMNGATEQQIERIGTSELFNKTPSHHEKLYLPPEQPAAGQLRRTFANPTPVAIAGFLLANTPASIQLMGWRHAGAGVGNASATVASYYYFGGLLLTLDGICEFILGNTFPCVVFLTFGAFWFTFGGTLTPFYAAVTSYGDDTAAFYDSFAYFLIFMGLLCLMYLICALRTNMCLVIILFNFVLAFGFLTTSYFYAADGRAAIAHSCPVGGGAIAFAASCVAWYLWSTMLLEAGDFSFNYRLVISAPSSRVSTRRQSPQGGQAFSMCEVWL
jgi:uncharacterized protein